MRIQVVAGVMAIGLAACVSANAQDAKAAEVLAAARKAIGEKKLDALKTLSVQSKVARNLGNLQAQTDVEMVIETPDKYVRTDVASSAMGISISTGFNGDRAIMPANGRIMPGGGAFVISMGGAGASSHQGEKPTQEQLDELNRVQVKNSRHEISRLMLGWFAMTHPALETRYTYAGEAESPDGKAHVIDAKDADGFEARLFIDQATNLPLMVTYKGRQPRIMTSTGGPGGMTRVRGGEGQPARELSKEDAEKLKTQVDKQMAELKTAMSQPVPLVEMSLFFDEWREVDGIKFPHVIRRASEGTTSEEWTVEKVKVNPRIDAKKFAVETR
jgi:hypothetical protein